MASGDLIVPTRTYLMKNRVLEKHRRNQKTNRKPVFWSGRNQIMSFIGKKHQKKLMLNAY